MTAIQPDEPTTAALRADVAALKRLVKDGQARIKGLEAKVSQQGHVLSETFLATQKTRRYTQKTRSDHNSLGMAYAALTERVQQQERWIHQLSYCLSDVIVRQDDAPEDYINELAEIGYREDHLATPYSPLAPARPIDNRIGPNFGKELPAPGDNYPTREEVAEWDAVYRGDPAPADRAVVVTRAMVEEAIAVHSEGFGNDHARMRGAIEAALRAAPAGADTTGEGE